MISFERALVGELEGSHGDRPAVIDGHGHCGGYTTLGGSTLDRIAGTEVMAIEILHDLGRRGVSVKSLTEPALDVDTSTPAGQAFVGIMAVFAQFRVDQIRANTKRGLAYARAQGRVGGRPTVMTPERVEQARRMRKEGASISYIAKVLDVGASSVSRALRQPASHAE